MSIAYTDYLLDNLKMYYLTIGVGDPILLIHGGMSRMQTFFPLLPVLSLSNQLYAVDLIGNGKSSKLDMDTDYTIELWVEHLIQFIGDVIQEPVILVGHSLGGFVASSLASQHAKLVKGLVIIETPLITEVLFRPGFWDITKYWRSLSVTNKNPFDIVRGIDQSQMGADQIIADHLYFYIASTLTQIDNRLLSLLSSEGIKYLLRGYDEQQVLSTILCPILILAADPDVGALLNDKAIKKIIDIVSHQHIFSFILLGTGHSPHRDDPDKVCELIASFSENLNG